MIEIFFILAGVFFGWTLLAIVGWFVSYVDKKFTCLEFPCVMAIMICGFAAIFSLGLATHLIESSLSKEPSQILENTVKE